MALTIALSCGPAVCQGLEDHVIDGSVQNSVVCLISVNETVS